MTVVVYMLRRAEDLFVTAKDSINVEEKKEWIALLSGLCDVGDLVPVGKEAETRNPPPTAGQMVAPLEKVMSHLLRFPELLAKFKSLVLPLTMHVGAHLDEDQL